MIEQSKCVKKKINILRMDKKERKKEKRKLFGEQFLELLSA